MYFFYFLRYAVSPCYVLTIYNIPSELLLSIVLSVRMPQMPLQLTIGPTCFDVQYSIKLILYCKQITLYCIEKLWQYICFKCVIVQCIYSVIVQCIYSVIVQCIYSVIVYSQQLQIRHFTRNDVQSPRGECVHALYYNPSCIGVMRNEILTRMKKHRQNGAILGNMSTHHAVADVSSD